MQLPIVRVKSFTSENSVHLKKSNSYRATPEIDMDRIEFTDDYQEVNAFLTLQYFEALYIR